MTQQVLVVDDDAIFRQLLGRRLEKQGWGVFLAANAAEAEALARQHRPLACVLDMKMPGASGLELVSRLLAIEPLMRIVMLTGYASIATAVEAIKRGASHYLAKPASVEEILAALQGESAPALVPEKHATSLGTIEWEKIQQVMQETGFNLSETARRLNMHRRTLQRKLQKPPR
jgi:two-component system response regulator RegA